MRFLVALALLALVVPSASAKIPPPPAQTAVVEAGAAPCGMAVVGSELWVAVYETGEVLRIDRTATITGRTRVGRWSCRIAVDERAVWVTRDRANEVVRIDRRSGRLRRFRVASPFDVVRVGRGLWVSNFEAGTVTRIDVQTGSRRVLTVGGHPAGLAWCGSRLWVGHGRTPTWLTAIGPRAGSAQRFDVVVASPGWPRCLRGELWVTTPGAVLRVSPRDGKLLAHVRLGGTPAVAGAAPGGLVYVTDKERSLVHRILPSGNTAVDTFPAGPGAYDLARFAGANWVTSFAGSDVRRFRP